MLVGPIEGATSKDLRPFCDARVCDTRVCSDEIERLRTQVAELTKERDDLRMELLHASLPVGVAAWD